MIIKVKIGDLTVRQAEKICRGYGDCYRCPLSNKDDHSECAFFHEDSPSFLCDYVDREIEVSTDIIEPDQAVSFEDQIKNIKSLKEEATAIYNTFNHFLKMNGYCIGDFNLHYMRYGIYKVDGLTTEPDSYLHKQGSDRPQQKFVSQESHPLELQYVWVKNLLDYVRGLLGDPINPYTLRRYWERQAECGYPFSEEQLEALNNLVKDISSIRDIKKSQEIEKIVEDEKE